MIQGRAGTSSYACYGPGSGDEEWEAIRPVQHFSCKYPHIKLPTKKDLRSSDEDESNSDGDEGNSGGEEKYPFVLTQGKKSYRVQITGIYSEHKSCTTNAKVNMTRTIPINQMVSIFGTTITINAFLNLELKVLQLKATWLSLLKL